MLFRYNYRQLCDFIESTSFSQNCSTFQSLQLPDIPLSIVSSRRTNVQMRSEPKRAKTDKRQSSANLHDVTEIPRVS